MREAHRRAVALSGEDGGKAVWPVEMVFDYGGNVFSCGAGDDPLRSLKWALKTGRVSELGFVSCWDVGDDGRFRHLRYAEGRGDTAEVWIPVDALEIYADRLAMLVDLCVLEAATMSLPYTSFGFSRLNKVLGELRAMGNVFAPEVEGGDVPWRKKPRSRRSVNNA
ncbi:hypothetical protein [Hyphomicrobium sp. DY-1]|uniref:hypothetical protein n=1 Tax=Hyphomicrobium sp. DY-1 TaxID=3075650 RepID=UPI0039C35FBD